ncbi:MAG: TonB-dependent receptor plug domain-containing protein [Acidobacteriota bacterium]
MALLVFFATAPARAQNADTPIQLKQLSLEELSQIQITSTRKGETPAFQAPAAITVMTAADIRRSGANSIPGLLRLIPGLEVAQIDSSKWAIGSRGFQGKLSRGMLVLIDGRSVYTPLFRGVYWDMQDTLLEDIDRIEVIRGPGGTIWGSNAVNGVINIITKSSRQTRGMLVSVGGGNVDQGFLNWRYGGGSDEFSYRIYGKAKTRGPEQHSNNDNFDDWRAGQTGFRADWKPNFRDSLTIQGDAYGVEAGQKFRISSYTPPGAQLVEGNGFFSGQNVMLAWQRATNDGSKLQLRTYYDRTDRQDLNYREVRHTFDADFLVNPAPAGRHEFAFGLGARVSPSRYFQTVATVDFLPHNQTYGVFSGFLQDQIALVPDKLHLTFGTKLEYNSFSGFNYQPDARLSWTPSTRQTIWMAVTRAVRTPSRIEDNFAFTSFAGQAAYQYVRLVGDGGFKPEQLLGYELGYRKYVSKGGFVTVSLFHNRYDGLLSVEARPPVVETSPAPAHTVLPLLLRNGVDAISSGGELRGLWDLREGWRVGASYSLLVLDAKNRPDSIDASTVGQLEGDTPRHKVVIQSFLDLPHKFELDTTYRQMSAVVGQRVPGYVTGDIRLGRTIANGLEFSLVGRNLLQPSHFEYGGNPGPLVGIKRSFFLKLTWSR